MISTEQVIQPTATDLAPSEAICEFAGSGPPTVNDDQTQGFGQNSRWYDEAAEEFYICVNAATGAAIWIKSLTSASQVHYGSVGTFPTNKLAGRSSSGTGTLEAITIGSGLTLSGGTLSATGGGITIGSTSITSGTNDRILYQSGGVVQQSGNLTFGSNGLVLQNNDFVVTATGSPFNRGINFLTQNNPAYPQARIEHLVGGFYGGGLKFLVQPTGSATNALTEAVRIAEDSTASFYGNVSISGGLTITGLDVNSSRTIVNGSQGADDVAALIVRRADVTSRYFNFIPSAAGSNPKIETWAELFLAPSGGAMRLQYDGSNYCKMSVASNGTTTFDAIGSGAKFVFSDNVELADGKHLVFGTSTGIQIGTSASQKIALWNKTPIVQPTTAIGGAAKGGGGGTTITDTDTFGGYTIAQIAKALIDFGVLA